MAGTSLATRASIAVALSGGLWFLSSGPNHVWGLAWVAPVPLLMVLPELHLVTGAVAVFVPGIALLRRAPPDRG